MGFRSVTASDVEGVLRAAGVAFDGGAPGEHPMDVLDRLGRAPG